MPGGWEMIIVLLFAVVPAILWLVALIDLAKSHFTDSINKLVWALIIIFVPFIGSIIYLVMKPKHSSKA
ncbi:PLDc_N domain-containing protein [Fulvivirga sp. RKSG066]|nr:PLDc_N domain-containing protein [Fulvivirga aurantia]